MRTDTVYAEPYPQEVRAAIYCRLSKDDDLSGPSASIQNQFSLKYTKYSHAKLASSGEKFFTVGHISNSQTAPPPAFKTEKFYKKTARFLFTFSCGPGIIKKPGYDAGLLKIHF